MNPILTPQKKDDTREGAYLGTDASLVVMFNRRVLQQSVNYAQIGVVPNLRVEVHAGASPCERPLHRIVLHDGGLAALLMALQAAGKSGHVVVEAWLSNNNTNLSNAGLNMETLAFRVPGLTQYSTVGLESIEGLFCGGFTFQGPGVISKYRNDAIEQTWDSLAELMFYGDTIIVKKFPPTGAGDNGAA